MHFLNFLRTFAISPLRLDLGFQRQSQLQLLQHHCQTASHEIKRICASSHFSQNQLLHKATHTLNRNPTRPYSKSETCYSSKPDKVITLLVFAHLLLKDYFAQRWFQLTG